MTTIAVIGATGYAGGHIAAEAVARGHQVIAVSRQAPESAGPGITIRTGSIADPGLIDELADEAAAVVVAVHAVANGTPLLLPLVPQLLEAAEQHGSRLGVIGGASSLLVAEGGIRLLDTPEFPDQFRAEASAHTEVLDALRRSDSTADWFYVSPAAEFGGYNPGERTGIYRIGGDVLLADGEGHSNISGQDLAVAVVDEIEHPAHHRQRFTVAY